MMCAVLNDIGYAVDFTVLNSKHYGVPQNRERIFIVCDRDVVHEKWRYAGNGVVAKTKRKAVDLGFRMFNFDWPTESAVTTRLRDVLEDSVTEKYYLTEEKTAKLIAQLNGHKSEVEDVVCINPRNVDGTQTYQQDRIYEATGVMTTLQAVMGGRFYVTDSPQIAGSLEHYGNDQMNRVYSIDGITSTVTALSGGGREQKVAELQQYTDGSGISYAVDANYAKGTSPGDVGNGRRTHVVETVALTERRSDEARAIRQENRRIGRDFSPRRGKVIVPRNDDIANCVTATQTIEQSLLEKPRYRIRKLTPLECWRLQGFSDAAHNTVEAAGVSDSQRYKQAGNAVTVNVIRAIGERLVPLITAITTTKEAA